MKIIQVKNLKEGSKYTEDILMDEDTIFVPALIPIKPRDIARLQKWGIDTVLTNGEEVVELTEEEEMLQEIIASQSDEGLLRVYLSSVERIGKIFDGIKIGRKVQGKEIDSIVSDLLTPIQEHTEQMIAFTLRNEYLEPGLAMSSINCLILSVVIAINWNIIGQDLVNIAIGALLHDVGMMQVPQMIKQKSGNLTVDELKQIRTHTLYSYKIIKTQLKYPDEIAMMGLQHHERWDGQGYPRKLANTAISLPARIVSVADAFEAMVRDRPYRNSMIGYTAMRQILNDNSRRFDPDILKVFIKSMGIYPIGSIVILNSGKIGKVVKIHSDAPLRPVIQILVDGANADEKEIIDLIRHKDAFIARAINPKELNKSG